MRDENIDLATQPSQQKTKRRKLAEKYLAFKDFEGVAVDIALTTEDFHRSTDTPVSHILFAGVDKVTRRSISLKVPASKNGASIRIPLALVVSLKLNNQFDA